MREIAEDHRVEVDVVVRLMTTAGKIYFAWRKRRRRTVSVRSCLFLPVVFSGRLVPQYVTTISRGGTHTLAKGGGGGEETTPNTHTHTQRERERTLLLSA